MLFFSFLQKHLGMILLFFGIVSFFIPQIFIPITPYTQYLLMFSFFLGCLKLDFSELLHLKKNGRKIFLFVAIQIIIFPFIFFLLTPFLSTDIRLGFFLIAAMSGAMLTPLLASFYNLKILWTLAFVTLTTFFLPIILPFFISHFFALNMDISFWEMMIFLIKILFLPLALALLFRKIFPQITQKIIPATGGIGVLCMSFFLAVLIAKNQEIFKENLFSLFSLWLLLGMFFLFLIKFGIGFLLPAQDRQEQWTNMLMFGNMNNGLAILFAAQFFSPTVVFITLLSEIPWVLAQPFFAWIFSRFFHK